MKARIHLIIHYFETLLILVRSLKLNLAVKINIKSKPIRSSSVSKNNIWDEISNMSDINWGSPSYKVKSPKSISLKTPLINSRYRHFNEPMSLKK